MANHGGKSVFIASVVIIFGLVIVGASLPVYLGGFIYFLFLGL